MGTILIWGAGKIGRGVAAEIFQGIGWHIVFARRNEEFVRKMREAGSYTIVTAEKGKERTVTTISGYDVYATSETEALADAVVRADLIIVPVMWPQLAGAAQQLVPGLLRRRAARPDDTLDILSCANMVNSALHFGDSLRQAMPPESLDWLAQKVGIVETLAIQLAIDPPAEDMRPEDPAMIYTGGPGRLHVDVDAFKGPIPDAPGIIKVHNPATEGMLKLWLGNLGYEGLSYRGYLRGHEYVYQCAADPVVVADVQAAMREVAPALVLDGRISAEEAEARIVNTPIRLNNPSSTDTIQRSGRDPRRKIGRNDRFMGPLLLARRYQLPFIYLARAVAAVFFYDNANDPEAVWIQQRVGEIGLRAAIFEICGLQPDETDVVDAVLEQYDLLKNASAKEARS